MKGVKLSEQIQKYYRSGRTSDNGTSRCDIQNRQKDTIPGRI
jgi:hypothetical protein